MVTFWYTTARRIMLFLLIGLAYLILAGCGASVVKININAHKNLNKDPNDVPHPILVKLFILGQKENFEAADYASLKNGKNENLAGDLLTNPIPITVAPKDTIRNYRIPINKQVLKSLDHLYIGMIAGYWNSPEGGWRKTVRVPKNLKTAIVFDLLEDQIKK